MSFVPSLSDSVRVLRLGALATVSGVLAGLAGWAFLTALDLVTGTRTDHPWLVWLLPPAGLVVGGAYHLVGGRAAEGNALLLDEIHRPTAWVPRRMAPLVAVGTVWSHLFGASVGREGTALQMSGSLTDLMARTLRLRAEDRQVLLIAALAGGFGAVFGVPAAATVFALEVQAVRRLRWSSVRRRRRGGRSTEDRPAAVGRRRPLAVAVAPAAVAAFVGDAVVEALGQHHEVQQRFVGAIDSGVLARVAVLGVLLGLTAVLFVEATDLARAVARRTIAWAPLRPAVAGLVVVAVVAVAGRDHLGLSIPLAEAALAGEGGGLEDPALKLALTALCLGFGFVGGEVTPLFVIGATLGGVAGPAIGLDPVTGATVGYVAVFAGAANVPVACTLVGTQLFGLGATLPVAVACTTAFLCSGNRGIYGTQRVGTAAGAVTVDTLPSATARARALVRRRRARPGAATGPPGDAQEPDCPGP
jgi:H+/Cl- antiporter ClcA